MPTYRFAIHHGAAETEKLGIMKLIDDAEAFAFAKRMIQDMIQDMAQDLAGNDRTQRNGCSVEITDGKRAVGRLSCDADPGP
jgi:hypothetical protein